MKSSEIPTETIEKAYEELPYSTFATWIRMMVMTPEQFIGRANMARSIGISQSQLDRQLRELDLMGYVRFIKAPTPGHPTEIVLTKRTIISGPTYFVNMCKTRPFNKEKASKGKSIAFIPWAKEKTGREKRKGGNGGKEIKGGVDMSKLRAIRSSNKKKVKDKRDSKNKLRSEATKLQKNSLIESVVIELDWYKLDQRGKPAVTFSPSRKNRKLMIEVLERSDGDRVKKALVNKLASEFSRTYTRYRRMLILKENKGGTYFFNESDLVYAGRAAAHCIRCGITPRQLLTYWHRNIRHFANQQMKIPPITFLSSHGNVETVSCSDLSQLDSSPSPPKNSFSQSGSLDSRVRGALEYAGFDVALMRDRHLLTIQLAAIPLAEGQSLFIDSDIRPMAEYLSKTIFKK